MSEPSRNVNTTTGSSAGGGNPESSAQGPGLVGSHAKWIKGAAENMVASLTGSEAWKKSGHDDQEKALRDLRAATAQRDPSTKGFGRVEEVAGRAVGCEGMRREGEASKTAAGRRRRD